MSVAVPVANETGFSLEPAILGSSLVYASFSAGCQWCRNISHRSSRRWVLSSLTSTLTSQIFYSSSPIEFRILFENLLPPTSLHIPHDMRMPCGSSQTVFESNRCADYCSGDGRHKRHVHIMSTNVTCFDLNPNEAAIILPLLNITDESTLIAVGYDPSQGRHDFYPPAPSGQISIDPVGRRTLGSPRGSQSVHILVYNPYNISTRACVNYTEAFHATCNLQDGTWSIQFDRSSIVRGWSWLSITFSSERIPAASLSLQIVSLCRLCSPPVLAL